ncbi:MAG TPA: carbohydrate kinase family protein [Candidatus Hydrogenedentes bacterium]|nr:carbohydrate kinase family protein [Candidatus Hydrogenedentota bacterium]
MGFDLVSLGVVCADIMVRPVDAIPAGGALGLVPQLEMHLGGLAGVTASVFSQLGGRSAFIGRVGHDGFGDYLLSALENNGVNTGGVRRVWDTRSSATVVLIDSSGERTFLHHVGANAETCEADVDFDVVSASRVLHWGGPAIMPQLDGAPMGRVFKRAKELGVRTSMDTCYDGKGVWFPLIEPSLPHLDIIFSSFEEARGYTGCDTPETIADFYLRYGVKIAVIKLGGDGLFIKSPTETLRLPAHKVDVVDTTGAGDASCGGFLYGWLQDWDLEKCGRFANAVGGLTVQRMGGAEAIEGLEQTIAFMETLS